MHKHVMENTFVRLYGSAHSADLMPHDPVWAKMIANTISARIYHYVDAAWDSITERMRCHLFSSLRNVSREKQPKYTLVSQQRQES